MRSILTIVLILAVVITGMSCKKGTPATYPVEGDYLIAGHSDGFVAGGNPVIYYLINNGQLRKDVSKTEATVPTDVSGFNFSIQMLQVSYAAVADLLTTIPSELLARNNAYIGSQVVADIPTLDVRTSIHGTLYRWTFSEDQSSSSAAVQLFYNRINAIH